MQKILSSKPNSQTLRRSADRKNDHALRPIFLKGATIMDALFTPPTPEVPGSMQSCWPRKPDFRHIPLQKRKNGSLLVRRLSILAGSWPVRSRGVPGLRSAIRCALSAASAWDKPERRQTACGKSQKFQPTFRCSPCKETSMLKSYTVFIDS